MKTFIINYKFILCLSTIVLLLSCSSESEEPTEAPEDIEQMEDPNDGDTGNSDPDSSVNLSDLSEGVLQNISVSPATISNSERSGVCPNTTRVPLAGTELYREDLNIETPFITFTFVNNGHDGASANVLATD